MSFPVAEMITQDVVATVGRIRLSGGFNTTLNVERFKKGGRNNKDHLTCVVGFLDDELVDDEDTADGFTYWRRPYWAIVYIELPESSEAHYDQLVDVARADIEKALSADVTRGGYAMDTKILAPDRFDPENDATGITVNFDVLYRTAIGDPYRTAPGDD